MQNLDPPHLVYVKADSYDNDYSYLSLTAGNVVYTKQTHDEYTKTMNNMFIIPLEEVVGVE